MKYLKKYNEVSTPVWANDELSDIINDILLPLKDNNLKFKYHSEGRYLIIVVNGFTHPVQSYLYKPLSFKLGLIKYEINHLIDELESRGFLLNCVRYQDLPKRNWTYLYDSSSKNRWGVPMPKDDVFTNIEGIDIDNTLTPEIEIYFENNS